MRRNRWTLATLVALVAAPLAMVPQPEWRRAHPDYVWSFPRDHGPHPGYKTEWWYFTGLVGDPGESTPTGGPPGASPPRLGFQFTLFKVGVVPDRPPSPSAWATADVFMGHMAVTDLSTGNHVFREVLYRAAPPYAGFPGGVVRPGADTIAWSLAAPGTDGGWSLTTTGGGFALSGTAEGLSMDLQLDTVSALVFQGPNGYSRKSAAEDRASMYYSYTDLRTSGSITVEGSPRTVTGTGWMDHEFSSDPLDEEQVGWDWFSLRLGDGRAIMAFQLRDELGRPGYRHLTVVDPGGRPAYPDPSSWALTPDGPWTSPATGASYPQRWLLTSEAHGLALTVSAFHPATENVSREVSGLYYWEGPVRVTGPAGDELGAGYLEMTGYGEGSRPAL
ncbi:MAG: carotenoid 1,2-hydratase [Gemmatimonadota bacterium]|nr:carotenoid 1,2-hydratase [Gemmatimonadota bacterium]